MSKRDSAMHADVDRIVDSLDDLTPQEVDEQLRSHGIEPNEAVSAVDAAIRKAVASVTPEKTHPSRFAAKSPISKIWGRNQSAVFAGRRQTNVFNTRKKSKDK